MATLEKTIARKQAVGIIERLKKEGQFFTVEFIKRTTGELRVMNCRGGVGKYVTGQGLAFEPKKKGLIGVWEANNKEGDKEAQAYRFISVEGIQTVIGDGKAYRVK
jgi:hypothetical protein